jgi:hypothetical protein
VVSVHFEVLLAEGELAVLTFEGKKVDEKACRVGALLSDSEKLSIAFGCWRCER